MKVGIILYVNRSGSTLFSRMLSSYSDQVFVFPELGFPVALLLARRAGRFLSGEALFALIRDDPRTEAIGVAEAALRGICARHSSSDMPALFAALATAAAGQAPRAIVLKLESLVYVYRAILSAFPDPAFVHVLRDPRAVANSMLRTPVPEKPGFDMARGSLVYAARHWRDYVRRVRRIGREVPVTQVRYEELRGSPAALVRVAQLLGIEATATVEGAAARYRVAAIDAPLHGKVHQRFDADRVRGWQDELSPAEVRVVETICWQEMNNLGYAPRHPRLVQWAPAMVRARLSHVRAMVRHGAVTGVLYARRPGGLADLRRRVRLAITARRG